MAYFKVLRHFPGVSDVAAEGLLSQLLSGMFRVQFQLTHQLYLLTLTADLLTSSSKCQATILHCMMNASFRIFSIHCSLIIFFFDAF
jgi:hypothetical protein